VPQILKEEVKDRFMVAAAEVFAKRGYKNTRLSDIVTGAGISVGNIYKYAADRPGLFVFRPPRDRKKGRTFLVLSSGWPRGASYSANLATDHTERTG